MHPQYQLLPHTKFPFIVHHSTKSIPSPTLNIGTSKNTTNKQSAREKKKKKKREGIQAFVLNHNYHFMDTLSIYHDHPPSENSAETDHKG
jgi:hypothetical protein